MPATVVVVCALVLGPAAALAAGLDVAVVYLTKQEKQKLPLSLLDPILEDDGVWGARLGLQDNQTTGRFLKHDYRLIEVVVPEDGDPAEAFRSQAATGARLFLADLRAADLASVAALPEAAEALIFNVRSPDDALRNEGCRANVFHIIPSRSMRTDALAQYLIWKKWNKWLVLYGKTDGDRAFFAALQRSAKKFNAKVVEERLVEEDAPSARTDSGHAQIQKQIPVLSQGAPDHDVVVVADEGDAFGEYLPYRTWDARPVAGTQGLIPTAWHRSHEQWGGTQIQRRLRKIAGRDMTVRDYANWAAMRAIGEAVTRTNAAAPGTIRDHLLGDKFKLAAFKGTPLTFRRWNQQLRQPVLLAAPRSLVSVSPQKEFLHQRTPLDTLGYDEPESGCKLQ
ncbi:MAG: ABC transporter substrate-binding protein [Kiloniellales bacterium]|nr:ABC transporter substrate-binding protein [Kiloniellales bacterium]